MSNIIDLKQLKIKFVKEDGNILTLEEIDKMLKNSLDIKEKWFYRALKHIYENHYTEAIKWLQLIGDDFSKHIIYILAFKLKDNFVMDNYKNYKNFEYKDLKPIFEYKGKLFDIRTFVF